MAFQQASKPHKMIQPFADRNKYNSSSNNNQLDVMIRLSARDLRSEISFTEQQLQTPFSGIIGIWQFLAQVSEICEDKQSRYDDNTFYGSHCSHGDVVHQEHKESAL